MCPLLNHHVLCSSASRSINSGWQSRAPSPKFLSSHIFISLAQTQRRVCCGIIMKKNDPHRFICLNAWSLVRGTVWEELGGRALLEEGKDFEIQKPTPSPVSSPTCRQKFSATALVPCLPALYTVIYTVTI